MAVIPYLIETERFTSRLDAGGASCVRSGVVQRKRFTEKDAARAIYQAISGLLHELWLTVRLIYKWPKNTVPQSIINYK